MRKNYLFPLLFLFFSFLTFSQTNLLKNPSFEDSFFIASENFDDWAINFNTIRTKVTDATDQTYAVKIQTNRSGSNGFFAQLSAATPSNDLDFENGKTYTISFDYKVQTGTITELKATLLSDNFYLEDEEIVTNQAANGWQTFTYDFSATRTASHNFDINLIGDTVNAEIIIDNTSIIEKIANPDRDVLIALYNATNGPNWLNTWDLNATDISTWYGVGLDANGRVTTLYLRENKLSGSLPPEIGQLSELKVLSLSNASNAAIPENNNQITGNLPPEIGNLSNLEIIELNNNPISGEIPIEIGNLSKLKHLLLANTNISGALPIELGNLSSLEIFNMRRSNLEGIIPSSIFNLQYLISFSVSNNSIEGEIPKEFSQLSSLLYLDLDSNQFTGLIPKELGQLTNLYRLDLSQNDLEGNIPPELGQLQNIEDLDLASCNLEGTLPSELGQLSNLRDFGVSGNKLSGTIPLEITQLPSLERAFLIGNSFEGEIPDFTSPNLSVVQVELNQFVFDDIISMSQNLNSSVIFNYYGQANIGVRDTIILKQSEAFTLSVNETVDQNNMYQWRKNGEPIANATNADYVINSFSNDLEGEYDCVITNSLLPDLTLYKNAIDLFGDDDNDGVANNIDNCSNTPPGAIVSDGGCSYLDVLVPKPDDFTAKATSTSCTNTTNGELSVTFKVNQTHYINVTGPNGYSESFTKQNGSTLTITDLAPGNYSLLVNSEIGVFLGAPNVEFNLNVETPEDLQSSKTIVDTTAKKGTLVVSGSKNYEVFVNETKMNFSFDDASNHQIRFELKDGVNSVLVKTDKNCQGQYSETVLLNSIRVFPNPTTDVVSILGLKNDESATISILDMSGVLIRSYSKDITETSAKINVEDLPEGMFLIRVKSKEEDVQTKIVKK